jgi:hypothetical protein
MISAHLLDEFAHRIITSAWCLHLYRLVTGRASARKELKRPGSCTLGLSADRKEELALSALNSFEC